MKVEYGWDEDPNSGVVSDGPFSIAFEKKGSMISSCFDTKEQEVVAQMKCLTQLAALPGVVVEQRLQENPSFEAGALRKFYEYRITYGGTNRIQFESIACGIPGGGIVGGEHWVSPNSLPRALAEAKSYAADLAAGEIFPNGLHKPKLKKRK